MPSTTSKVNVAREQWDRLGRYRQRYEIEDRLDPVISLQRSIERRKGRLAALIRRRDELESEISNVEAELRAVSQEIEGSAAAGALLISEILDRVLEEQGETWSPTAVRGFRVWRIVDDRVLGSQVHWPAPTLTSTCLREIPGEDLPHATSRCGPPACGIYAVKELDLFPADVAGGLIDRSVVGVVGLRGKVVEHTGGYRGQHAEVVALAARFGTRRLLTVEKGVIEALFTDPVTTITTLGSEGPPDPEGTRSFLEACRDEELRWTSEEK